MLQPRGIMDEGKLENSNETVARNEMEGFLLGCFPRYTERPAQV